MKTMKSKKFLLSVLSSSLLTAGLLISVGGQAQAAPTATLKTYSQPPFDLYKVSQNDTLYFIGKRYGVSVDRMLQLNPGINPYKLQPGDIIRLRGTASQQQPGKSGTGSSSSNSGSTSTTPAVGSFEQQVFTLVNQERAKSGLAPLRLDAKLSGMAKDKAIDMYKNNYFDHNSPTYGSPFDMMKSYGISYSYAGENIAKGQKTPQDVMKAWMNSTGHRANILNTNFNTIGVAYYNGEWVQEFIRS